MYCRQYASEKRIEVWGIFTDRLPLFKKYRKETLEGLKESRQETDLFFGHVRTQLPVSFLGFRIIRAMPAPIGTAVPSFHQVTFGHYPVALRAEVKIFPFNKIIIFIGK